MLPFYRVKGLRFLKAIPTECSGTRSIETHKILSGQAAYDLNLSGIAPKNNRHGLTLNHHQGIVDAQIYDPIIPFQTDRSSLTFSIAYSTLK